MPLAVYEFCGIVYNHQTKEVSIGRKTRDKLEEANSELRTSYASISSERAFELFGLLLYAHDVLRPELSRSHLYFLFKNIRKLARRAERGDMPRGNAMWESNKKPMQDWAAEMADINARRRIPVFNHDSPVVYLFTDASMSGWGATIFDDTAPPRGFAAAWPAWLVAQQPNIAELEALGLAFALLYLNAPPNAALHIRVDNTNVLWGVAKGLLRNHAQARALSMIADIVERRSWHIESVEWVASERNPADWLSRVYEKRRRTN